MAKKTLRSAQLSWLALLLLGTSVFVLTTNFPRTGCAVLRNLTWIHLSHGIANVSGGFNLSLEEYPRCGQWVSVAQGLMAWSNGNWRESLSLWKNAEMQGVTPILLKRIGDAYESQGDSPQAIQYWARAGDYKSVLFIGDKAYQNQSWELAKRAYQLVIDNGPQSPNVYQAHLGLALTWWHGFRSMDDAQREFETTIRIRPDYLWPYIGLGDLLREQHAFLEAIYWYNRGHWVAPNDPSPLFHLGLTKYEQGDLLFAERYVSKVLELNPAYARALWLRGRIRLESKDTSAAVYYLTAATSAEPTQYTWWLELGDAYLAEKKLDQAREAYQRALLLRPDYETARQRLLTLPQSRDK